MKEEPVGWLAFLRDAHSLSRSPFVSVTPFVSVHKSVTIVRGAPIVDPPQAGHDN